MQVLGRQVLDFEGCRGGPSCVWGRGLHLLLDMRTK